MKRPFLWLLTGLVSGETVVFLSGRSGFVIMALSALSLCVVAYRGQGFFALFFRKKELKMALFLWSFAVCSGGFLFLSEDRSFSFETEIAKEGEKGELTGTLIQIRPTSGDNVELMIKDGIFTDDTSAPRKLYIRKTVRMLLSKEKAGSLLPGDVILAKGSLKRLEAPVNPGEFDAKTYYRSRGIACQFLASSMSRIGRRPYYFRTAAHLLRQQLSSVYENVLKKDKASIINALVLGDKSGLSLSQKNLYEENGMSHLLAVSGLHTAIVGGQWFALSRKRGRGYLFSCVTGAFLLMFYATLTGFGNSTVRAVIMYLIYLGAQLLGAEYDLLSAMSLAGFLMLCQYPCRILEGGFQISFAAVAAIGLVFPWMKEKQKGREEPAEKNARKKIKGKLADAFLMSVTVSLVTAPLIMRHFYQWSPYAVFLNLIILPCMTPLMLSAFAAGATGLFLPALALIFGKIPGGILSVFHFLLSYFRKLPGAVLVTGCLSVPQIVALYLAEGLFLYLFMHRNWQRLRIFFVIISVLFLFRPEEKLRIIMLDVGQGQCIMIKTPKGHTILLDGGSSSEKSVGRYVMLPALKYFGSAYIDNVMVSHTDKDHISGLEELLEMKYPIKNLILPALKSPDEKYSELIQKAGENGTNVLFIKRGEKIKIEQLIFRSLHPSPEKIYSDKNEASMVLYMTYGDFDALFPGDLEGDGEEEMCEYFERMNSGKTKRICLLQTAHHGSRNSTNERVLRYLAPQAAFISVGENNRYGHPHRETLQRLDEAGCKVRRTDREGAVQISIPYLESCPESCYNRQRTGSPYGRNVRADERWGT